MYFRTDMASSQAVGYLQQAFSQVQAASSQIASGTVLTSAANDPAGSAISAAMQAQAAALGAGYQNIQDGVGMLGTASAAMRQIQGLLQDLYRIATQAANDTNNLQDRITLQQQMDQYTHSIADLVNQTAYNGLPLLAGVLGQTKIDVGQKGGGISFSLPALDPVSLGIAGNIPKAIMDTGWQSRGGGYYSSYVTSVTPLGNFGSGSLVDSKYSVALISAHLDTIQGQGYYQYSNGSTTNLARISGHVTISADGNGGTVNNPGWINNWETVMSVLTPTSSTAGSTQGAWAPINMYYAGLTPGTYLFNVTTNSAGTGISSFEFSKDGGSTWIPLPIPGNPGYAANGSLNLVQGTSMGFSNPNFIGVGVGKQLSPGSLPGYSGGAGTGIVPNSTPNATDTYQLTFTPAQYTYELQNGRTHSVMRGGCERRRSVKRGLATRFGLV